MRRFGESRLFRFPSTFVQRIKFFLFGHDFIGAAIRLSHFKRALSLLKKEDIHAVLDAGCGTGDFSFYVAEKYPVWDVFAYDIKEATLQQNKNIQNKMNIKNMTLSFSDLLKLSEKEKYDFIFSIGTLIYFSKKETKRILKNLSTALKKGGYLYLDLPQEDFLEINYIHTKYYPQFYNALKSENSGDLYTFAEMKQLLDEMGFEIAYTTKSFTYTGKFAWELDNLLREHGFTRTRYLFLPILKILCNLDAITKHKKGCCFVILARRG